MVYFDKSSLKRRIIASQNPHPARLSIQTSEKHRGPDHPFPGFGCDDRITGKGPFQSGLQARHRGMQSAVNTICCETEHNVAMKYNNPNPYGLSNMNTHTIYNITHTPPEYSCFNFFISKLVGTHCEPSVEYTIGYDFTTSKKPFKFKGNST